MIPGRAVLAASALAVMLTLGGCTVDWVPARNPGGPTPSQVVTAATTSATAEDELQDARRSYWAPQVTVTTSCPTGEIVISGDDQTVLITGDCRRVVVRGEYTNVLAGRVDTLVVEETASDGVILVKSAKTIDIKADYISVYWDEGNPGVTMDGNSTANPNPVKE